MAKPPTQRIVALLTELDARRRITLARARELYGLSMSDATWKRVKKRLEAFGCKLRWDAASRNFFVSDPLWSLETVRGAPDRRTRLATLRAAAAALGAPYSDTLGPLFERWDLDLASAEGERAGVSPRRPQPRADAAFFDRLRVVETALRDRRMLRFSYVPSAGGKAKERQIEPYGLHDYIGRFYVWGRERVKQAPKFFALDLMRDVELEDRFEPDPSLSLDKALQHSFGMFVRSGAQPKPVIVEVAADRASFVRSRRWPAETLLTDLPEGRLRIEFSVTDPQEIVAWVLSFAGSARIVAPTDAADLARSAGEEIARLHRWAKDAPKGRENLEFDWSKEP
jgi:predicted DNA-binding transcriptional regulator YafY